MGPARKDYQRIALGPHAFLRYVRLFEGDHDADGAAEVAFFAGFSWIPGDVRFAFRFTVAGQASGDVIDRHDDPQCLALIGEFADIGFGSRAA